MLLRMDGIGKAFSGKRVLSDVCFELAAGEVHVLAGENGAGKSTLVNILGGVYADYDGHIFLDGEEVAFANPADAARHGIAMVHQELSLIPSMTVLDNVFLGREEGVWVNRRGQRARASHVFDHMALSVPLDAVVGGLPLANRQMIEIAKGLIHDARVIVMDEPTSALGERETERLFEIIADLKAKGCGVIFISHRMREVYQLADRITVFRDGDHVGTEDASSLSEEKLVQWMVGRKLSGQFPPRTGAPSTEALRVEGAWVRDPSGRSRWAAQDVSFAVQQGEILGLAGLQGSGNSEILGGLFGVHGRLPRGRVTIYGREITVRSPRQAIQHGLALVTNERKRDGLVLSMSIVANVTRAAGGWIAKKLGGKGNVVELKGLMTSTPGQDRNSGFRDGIKGSEITIIFEADMKWLEPDARKEMESALARFQDIDLVYAHNDPGAHGAYLAAKAAGRGKDMLFVGIDALPQEGQAYVKQGILSASFEYPTGGREAIDLAMKILAGEDAPKEITLSSKFYTPDNIEQGGEAIE